MLPTDFSDWMNNILKSVKVSGFTQKCRAAKRMPTWQLMDVLSWLKLLNALTALTLFRYLP
jgi:hypothetical protein